MKTKNTEQIKTLLQQGKSVAEIAKHIGVDRSSLYSYIKKEGIPLPQQRGAVERITPEVVQQVEKLASARGIDIKQASKELKLNPKSIYQARLRHRRKAKGIVGAQTVEQQPLQSQTTLNYCPMCGYCLKAVNVALNL